MKTKSTIVHIIHRSVFCNGYRRFMDLQFQEYNHVFFTKTGNTIIDDHERTYEIKDLGELIRKPSNKELIMSANRIIVSGVFFSVKEYIDILKNPAVFHKFINKSFFQFWGADFYKYRNKTSIKDRVISFYIFRKAAGLIFLIPGEEKVFQDLTHVFNRHYIAPMPGDPEKAIDFTKYRKPRQIPDKIKILVGNSASVTNHHLEVFEMLKSIEHEKIMIYCPLSYGDENYKKQVIEAGKIIFGASFIPITKFMNKDRYIRFLSGMDIGIFNNDRQQALGNISILLSLGKKLYLRQDTTMWGYLTNKGYRLSPISSLKNISFSDFYDFPDNDYNNNIGIYSPEKSLIENKKAWQVVFNSKI